METTLRGRAGLTVEFDDSSSASESEEEFTVDVCTLYDDLDGEAACLAEEGEAEAPR